MLKGIRVGSKEELRERIMTYFDEVNEVPVLYRWTCGLDDIDLRARTWTPSPSRWSTQRRAVRRAGARRRRSRAEVAAGPRRRPNQTVRQLRWVILGWNFRKYGGKLITKPSKKSVGASLAETHRSILAEGKGMSQDDLVRLLPPKVRGFANYHRHACGSGTFSRIAHVMMPSSRITAHAGRQKQDNLMPLGPRL